MYRYIKGFLTEKGNRLHFVKHIWHHRSMCKETANRQFPSIWKFAIQGDEFEGPLGIGYLIKWYKLHPKSLKYDCIQFWRAITTRFWAFQPLGCNGNKGGWRTNICDWLDNKIYEREL